MIEEIPVVNNFTEENPVEEVLVEETPVEEVLVEEVPVEEVPAETEFFKLPFSPKEFTDLWTTYTEASQKEDSAITGPAQGMAQDIIRSLVYDPEYTGKMDYEGLRKGTSPILKELGYKPGEGLTDEQIINLFAEDDEGQEIEINPGRIEGMKRSALGSATGTGSFFAGMKLGNMLVSGVPPVTPWTAGVRIGFPIITGIGAYIGGRKLGNEITDVFMGEEGIIIPGSGKADYEVGKAIPEAISFMITPWMVGTKGISLGGRVAVENAKNFYGPIISNTGVTKVPKSARVVNFIEDAIGRMGQKARSNPYNVFAIELGGAGGSIVGTYAAEKTAPDNPWVRFGLEAGFGVTGALAVDAASNKLPFLLRKGGSGLYNLYQKMIGEAPTTDLQQKYGLSEDELTTAGNFIIEQLEKNQENPQALYDLINDSQFDKWLTDETGKKIELDPATRSASITLLALQNQFIDAAPEAFGSDAGKKMNDAVDALRRALLALYADGSKSALSDAAGIQTSLFEATLQSKIANSLRKTQEAFKKVGPDGENSDIESAQKIFTILDNQYNAGRGDEQGLWRQIPKDVELNSFINEDGVTTNTPNFVTTWNRLLGQEVEEVKNAILKADELQFLNQFVERTSAELNLSSTDSPPPILPEQRKLNTALDKIAGSNNANLPKEILQEMTDEGASVEDIMARLREEASKKRGRFSTPRTRELANALDAQANFLAAQKRQSKEFADQALADGTAELGLNAYDLVRIRGRALNMGKRLAANNLNDESRWAYEMADSLLADLNGLDIGVSKKYDTARSFSYAFNQVFTRSYAGDVLGTKKNGAPKVPVEVLANTLMKGDAASYKAAQLNGVSNFQITQSLTNLLQDSTKDLLSAGSAQEFKAAGQVLLEDFQKGVDPNTKTMDMDVLRAWYGRNEDAIKDIPGLNTRVRKAMNEGVELNNAQENLLRTVRKAALNEDGTLNTSALSNWLNDTNNQRLLTLFPQVGDDLKNTQKASALLTQVKKDTAEELSIEKSGIGLYELLPDKTTNPTVTISKALALNQDRPFPIMNKYMKMINDVGEDGFTVIAENSPNKGQTWTRQDLKDGLRATIYETVFNASGGKRFSPSAAFNRLFAKHPNGDISVGEWMTSNDLIGEDQLKDTAKFLRKMAEIEAFTMKAKPGQTDEFYADISEGVKLLAAMGGSAAGTNLKRALGFESGTGDLVIAGRSARFGQQLMEKYMAELPASLQASRVAIILQNEPLLKLVLKNGRTDREKDLLARQLAEAFEQSYVVQPARRIPGSAVQVISEESNKEDGEAISPVVNSPTNNQSNIPAGTVEPAPQINEVPAFRVVPPVQQNPSRFNSPEINLNPSRLNNQGAGLGSIDRTRYAAMFPNDSASALIKQGIGSMVG